MRCGEILCVVLVIGISTTATAQAGNNDTEIRLRTIEGERISSLSSLPSSPSPPPSSSLSRRKRYVAFPVGSSFSVLLYMISHFF